MPGQRPREASGSIANGVAERFEARAMIWPSVPEGDQARHRRRSGPLSSKLILVDCAPAAATSACVYYHPRYHDNACSRSGDDQPLRQFAAAVAGPDGAAGRRGRSREKIERRGARQAHRGIRRRCRCAGRPRSASTCSTTASTASRASWRTRCARLGGFERSARRRRAAPRRDALAVSAAVYEEMRAMYAARPSKLGRRVASAEPVACTGPDHLRRPAPRCRRISRTSSAAMRTGRRWTEGFITALSPNNIALNYRERVLPDDEEYLSRWPTRCARSTGRSSAPGFVLQIDDPWLATHYDRYPGAQLEDCRGYIAQAGRGHQPRAARPARGPGAVPHLLQHQRRAARGRPRAEGLRRPDAADQGRRVLVRGVEPPPRARVAGLGGGRAARTTRCWSRASCPIAARWSSTPSSWPSGSPVRRGRGPRARHRLERLRLRHGRGRRRGPSGCRLGQARGAGRGRAAGLARLWSFPA